MFSRNEFVRWVDVSHDLFEIFEGRYDADSLARKWVDEWFSNREFTVNLISNLNFNAFGIKESSLQEKMKFQLLLLLETRRKKNTMGFAGSFFFFTWNLQRFKRYYSKNGFLAVRLFQECRR